MPLFEYRCFACERTVEVLVRGAAKVRCPHCQSSRLAKLISVPAPAVSAATAGSTGPCGDPIGPGGCCGGGGCDLN